MRPVTVLRASAMYSAGRGRVRDAAVAIGGGRILGAGPAADVLAAAPAGAGIVDLPGATIFPGFQDAHVHPDHGGLDLARCGLARLRGERAYLDAVARFATAHPDAAWIVGGGWSLPDFANGTPRGSLLDAVVPDRPAFLVNRDGHGAWVNARALEVAGVTAATPDPTDGRIERDAEGSPSGVLHEGAMNLVRRHVPEPSEAELDRALLDAQAYLHSLGVTAWQDAMGTPRTLAAYRRLADRAALTARVVVALWWDRDRGLEQVDGLVELRRTVDGDDRLRADSVKIMQDGIAENFTAAMLRPYLDGSGRPTGNRGTSFVDPASLRAAVARLDGEGFQVHVHAIGDRAVREALDAFEHAVAANGRHDARHHVAHLQVVHPQDVPRFAELRVAANCQPYWACLDDQMRDLCVPFLGPERVRTQYPFRALLEGGARLAFGSDWPVSTPDPLKEMQVAVTRIAEDVRDGDPFLPDQRLTLEEALDAFTAGSAFVNRLESSTGTLEEGKVADVAVVDADLWRLDPLALGDANVILTLVGGEPVFGSL